MALHPILPVIAGESLTSYLNRVARFHCEMDLFEFLSFIELARSALITPQEETIARLKGLLGLSEETLGRMAFQSAGGRVRVIAAETVHAEFTAMKTTSFCPNCLLEDGKPDSPSQGMRVGRIAWQIGHLRTCLKHGVELVRRPVSSYSDGLQIMAKVAPDDATLRQLAMLAPERTPTGLEHYIANRLAGERGPAWLDGQPIDLAARACEMLGVILTAGTHVNLKALDAFGWHKAGDAGFRAASRGAEGIRQTLELHATRIPEESRRGGPQHVLGRLYQWLQFKKNTKAVGPIREVVREFILDSFPIAAGTDLFGETVDCQRVHSVYSLAKVSTLHPKTISRAMVLAGIADGDPNRVQAHLVFDAEEGEALARRIETSLTVKALEGHLNCNRVQAQQLVRSGVIPRIIEGKQAVGALKGVAETDANAFLERFMAQAKQVDVASPGGMDIVAAAEVARWPVLDIINGVISGLFTRVEVVEPELKFKGVLVDPEEVRTILYRNKGAGRVGIEEAAALIGMPVQGVNALVKLRDGEGAPYLREYSEVNAKGATVRLFDMVEILAFRRGHVSLKEIAEAASFSPKVMKMKMDARGAVPLTPRYELGRVWYRKTDLSS
ncbi:TniQ family protein [Sulfitobacter sp. W027]|uniref:TniQ family protein n=1 Tax=Sulfitobacter sp. W027 TaxID=2867025 RepID=UPI0021A8253B|nr:TniQ family protein [Sulfitobacter sp. W027]UWR33020.1 TniQ family protein [Sulfitobacter sp. W027]